MASMSLAVCLALAVTVASALPTRIDLRSPSEGAGDDQVHSLSKRAMPYDVSEQELQEWLNNGAASLHEKRGDEYADEWMEKRIPPFELHKRLPPFALSKRIPPFELTKRIPPFELVKRLPPFALSKRIPPFELHKRIPPFELHKRIPPFELHKRIPPFELAKRIPPFALSKKSDEESAYDDEVYNMYRSS